MHRYTIFLLLILSLVLGGVVWARPAPPSDFDIPFAIDTASNSCSTAATINIPGGDITDVKLYSNINSPDLTCQWGAPSSSTGYRTAWYKFTAVTSGIISIDTFGSNYDTVLAVWKDISPADVDPCTDFTNSMQLISCQDDSRGLTSNTTITVRKGETYYIEVADWDDDAPSTKSLQITVLKDSVDSFWSLETSMPTAVSRHATAVAGSNIYVIGGQSAIGISDSLYSYNALTDKWTTLPDMPGSGYANTTAAFVDDAGTNDNGRIYLPSGYTGAPTNDMTHWAYDIQGSYWLTRTAITDALSGTQPFGWATAVADPSVSGYYLMGGVESTELFSGTATVKNQMYLYIPDARGGSWLPRTNMNSPRYAHTAALVNGRVCVVGGIGRDITGENILLIDGECFTQGSGWATIAAMNVPRYAATSAVGGDGRWYVFGGIDANGNTIPETEVYDPETDTWTLLPVNYDLGGSAGLPTRGWLRGGAVGSTFYAIGGVDDSQTPMALVESLFLPTDEVLLPIILSNYGDINRPDDNFNQARLLTFNVPQYRNFDNSSDYFDVYYFDLPSFGTVTTKLTQVPSDSDYNIYIYNSNKLLWGKGENLVGSNESVQLTLNTGRYYVIVERIWPFNEPNTANYRIIVEK